MLSITFLRSGDLGHATLPERRSSGIDFDPVLNEFLSNIAHKDAPLWAWYSLATLDGSIEPVQTVDRAAEPSLRANRPVPAILVSLKIESSQTSALWNRAARVVLSVTCSIAREGQDYVGSPTKSTRNGATDYKKR